jgi:MarR family transcriptional regulator, transcriptional regulator for hemolysin
MGEKSDKSIGRALILASRLQRARLGEQLQASGLFPGQEVVLEALAAHGPMPMGELAERLDVRPPTVSKTITRLSAQGLVKRSAAGGDGRLVSVELTEDGLAKAKSMAGVSLAVEKEMLVGLDSKDRKRLRKALKKMAKNLAHASGRMTAVDEPDDDSDEA